MTKQLQISLAAARVNANMTQGEVAKELKKNKSTIANWESGKTEIDCANLLRLCELYSMPQEYIFLPTKSS